jgi:hypothetical protein
MLDLNDFFYFVQVVDRGGFTAASRTLRVPKDGVALIAVHPTSILLDAESRF